MTLARRTSVIVPAFNEEHAVGAIVAGLRARPNGWKFSSSTMARATERRHEAAVAGARVVRHPYNKGNGAAVKTGIRQCAGEFVLIVDADGQHRRPTRRGSWHGLDAYDLVVGARSARSQATWTRRSGNALLNWLAGYLADRTIPT